MEEATLKKVEQALAINLFRNKSHFIEVATENYLKEVNHE